MYRIQNTLVLVLAVSLVLGCRTIRESDDELNQEDLGDNELPVLDQVDQSIPVSLWSPEQRRSTAGYYYLAAEMMAMQEQDIKQALPIFEAAYNLDPNPFLGSKLIAAKASVGERREALADAKKMALLYPDEGKIWFLYGQLLEQSGQPKDAVSALERAIKLDPAEESPYLMLIDIYMAASEQDNAMAITKALVKNNPGSVAGWMQLSRLYLAKSQYKEALVPARKAYEMQSSNPQLIQIYAITLQLNGQADKAIPLYEALYRLNPTDESLTQRMVDLYREVGNLSNALELLSDLQNVSDAARPGIEMQKAYLLWELERFEEAALILTKLSREFPESDKLRYLSGLGQERLGNFMAAIQTYETIPQDSSYWNDGQFRAAVAYREMKQFDKAVEIGEALVKSGKADWDAYLLLGGLFSDQEDYAKAIEITDQGYKQYPDKHRLLFMKGVHQEKSGDIDDCIKTMRAVLEKDPTNSSAYNYLGYLFAERGENLDEAEKLIRKALELKPNDGFYLDSLGWVYYQRGDLDNAEKYLVEALKQAPDEGVILEHIADVKLKRADKLGAREFYTRALKGKLEKKDRGRVEEKLKKLES